MWLDGKCDVDDVIELGKWVLPHRIELTKVRVIQEDIEEILERERVKMREREARRQWYMLNELYKKFDRELYRRVKEMALEDLVLAEELARLEAGWVRKGLISKEETLYSYLK